MRALLDIVSAALTNPTSSHISQCSVLPCSTFQHLIIATLTRTLNPTGHTDTGNGVRDTSEEGIYGWMVIIGLKVFRN